MVDHSSVHASHGSLPADFTPEERPQQVADENQDARCLKEYTDGYDEIPDVPAATRFVGIDSAGHAQNARNCMKSNVRWNPIRNSQKCIRPSASLYILPGHLGEPIVESAEQREKNAADDYVVKVRDDNSTSCQVASRKAPRPA